MRHIFQNFDAIAVVPLATLQSFCQTRRIRFPNLCPLFSASLRTSATNRRIVLNMPVNKISLSSSDLANGASDVASYPVPPPLSLPHTSSSSTAGNLIPTVSPQSYTREDSWARYYHQYSPQFDQQGKHKLRRLLREACARRQHLSALNKGYLNPWTLAFASPEIEYVFLQDLAHQSVRYMQVSLCFAIVSWSVFFGMDSYQWYLGDLPDGRDVLLARGLSLASFVTAFAVSFFFPNVFRDYMQPLVMSTLAVLGLSSAHILAVCTSSSSSVTGTVMMGAILSLVLVVITYSTLLRLRFVYAIVLTVTTFLYYQTLSFFLYSSSLLNASTCANNAEHQPHGEIDYISWIVWLPLRLFPCLPSFTSPAELISALLAYVLQPGPRMYATLYFFFVASMELYACYSIELFTRRQFLMSHQLNLERKRASWLLKNMLPRHIVEQLTDSYVDTVDEGDEGADGGIIIRDDDEVVETRSEMGLQSPLSVPGGDRGDISDGEGSDVLSASSSSSGPDPELVISSPSSSFPCPTFSRSTSTAVVDGSEILFAAPETMTTTTGSLVVDASSPFHSSDSGAEARSVRYTSLLRSQEEVQLQTLSPSSSIAGRVRTGDVSLLTVVPSSASGKLSVSSSADHI